MNEQQTKNVTLRFKRSALIYDIENVAYVEGEVMEAESDERRKPVIDIAQDGNIDRVTRIMDLAFAYAVEVCYPYTKENTEDEIDLDDTLMERNEYVMRLSVPSEFSRTTVTILLKLIHEFIVDRVLADWLSITDKVAAQNWYDKAALLEEQIQTNLNTRTGFIYRRQSPF